MDYISENNQQQQSSSNINSSSDNRLSYANQLQEATNVMASLTRLLLESSKTLATLRREFRGEAFHQNEDGTGSWIQISKPIFIKIDETTEKPLRERIKFPNGELKEIYVPNDEAIEEVLSMLKFAGINQITPITKISDNNVLDDLKEFECKLAGTLCLKQKEWGIDKELLPMIQFKIKTIVQDSRYMACNGTVLRALQTTVQRVEQAIEGERIKQPSLNPYAH